MARETLHVDRSASKSLSSVNSFLTVIAWIGIISGAATTLIGLDTQGLWILGLSLIGASISTLITTRIILGLIRITESAEYYKAQMEATYEIPEPTQE